MLARLEGFLDQRQRGPVLAADQLDDNVGVGFRDRMNIAHPVLEVEAMLLGFVALTHGDDFEPAPRAIVQRLAVRQQCFDHAAANRAQACDRDSERIAHFAPSSVAGSLIRIDRNFFTLRAAWRMRCSFSTSAIRT